MNKLAVITGGTKGIGRAIVEVFANQGFSVATCSRNEADLKKLTLDIRQEYNVVVHTFVADLNVPADVAAFGTFVQQLGNVEVLVSNAARYETDKILEEEKALLPELLQTNVLATYQLCQLLAPAMKAAQRGHIFTICSVASLQAIPDIGSYCVSKAALYSLTKVLQQELKAFGVKVTAILPGATLTASWDNEPNKPDNILLPADVAATVLGAYQLSKHALVEEIHLAPLQFGR